MTWRAPAFDLRSGLFVPKLVVEPGDTRAAAVVPCLRPRESYHVSFHCPGCVQDRASPAERAPPPRSGDTVLVRSAARVPGNLPSRLRRRSALWSLTPSASAP